MFTSGSTPITPNLKRTLSAFRRFATSQSTLSHTLGWVAILSASDLGLTLYFMTTSGMDELNPLARAVVALGPGALVAFKVLSVCLATGILWACRDRWTAHLAAWLLLALLGLLSVHWARFVAEVIVHGPPIFEVSPTFVRV